MDSISISDCKIAELCPKGGVAKAFSWPTLPTSASEQANRYGGKVSRGVWLLAESSGQVGLCGHPQFRAGTPSDDCRAARRAGARGVLGRAQRACCCRRGAWNCERNDVRGAPRSHALIGATVSLRHRRDLGVGTASSSPRWAIPVRTPVFYPLGIATSRRFHPQ